MILMRLALSLILLSYYVSNCEVKNKNVQTSASIFRIQNSTELTKLSVCNVTLKTVNEGMPKHLPNKSLLQILNFRFDVSWIPLILTCVLCSLSYAIMKFTPFARKFNALPGDLIVPFIGSCYIGGFSVEKGIETLSRAFERHGGIFRMWAFHQKIVFVADADSLQGIMSGREQVQKPKVFEDLKWIMGNGLVTSDAEVWREDRKIMDPSFKYQRFDGFLEIFNKHCKILVRLLEERFEGIFEPQNLHSMLCLCNMDFITGATLGVDTSFQYDTDNEFVRNTQVIVDSFRTRNYRPWMKLPIIWQLSGWAGMEKECAKYFKNYFAPIVHNRRQLISNCEVEDGTKPFIDSLIEIGKSDADIIAHAITVFLAAFETSSTAMNYTLFLLALNPQHQAKVHKELDEIFESDPNRDVTFNDLAEMKYLEMCLKEAMRIYTPAPIAGRFSRSDTKLKNGMVVPKGCDIIISIYHLHRDPRVFPDPETFNPERFKTENCQKLSNYSYMPFSAGPRNCIGGKYAMMEMKTLLAILLRKFHVTTNGTRENLRVTIGIVLQPAGCGIKLMLTKRDGEM